MLVPRTAENLRYLLWREKVQRDRWAVELAARAGIAVSRAKDLLNQRKPSPDEQRRIADAFVTDESELVHARLAEHVEGGVLNGNLNYLADQLVRGEKRKLANAIGIHPTTLSDWLSGKREPQQSNLEGFARYFGISANVDLRTTPIFLSMLPVGDLERKAWLRERILEIDATTLAELFPALQRLLGGQ
jgi:transcriptional regulator with XRE-family HTH domain